MWALIRKLSLIHIWLINQLKDTKNFKFIGAYFDITVEISAYIKYLNMSWPEVFSIALSERLLTENQIRRYSIFSLYYSDDDIIELVNKENCLCDYISNAQMCIGDRIPYINLSTATAKIKFTTIP